MQPWPRQWNLRYNTKRINNQRKKMDKLDFIKILNFHASKDTIKKVKKQLIEQKKTFEFSAYN